MVELPRIQLSLAIADKIKPGRAKSDIVHRSPETNNEQKNLQVFQNSTTFSKDNSIFKQLHLDKQPQTQLEDINRKIHQSIRVAKLDHLIGQPIFAHSDALITPLATFGGFSVQRCTRIIVHSGRIAHTQSRNALDAVTLQCAFCSAFIPLAEVLSRFRLSGSPKCTLELLATLSTEHKTECRGLKGAERLKEDDVQFGVSERSCDIDANIVSSRSTQ